VAVGSSGHLVSHQAGVSWGPLSEIESGLVNPSAEEIQRIGANALQALTARTTVVLLHAREHVKAKKDFNAFDSMQHDGQSLDHKQAWMRERHVPPQPVDGLPHVIAFERHFTPKELAGLWCLDETTIRRMFQDEPGVLRIGKSDRRDGKRDYVSLRIPESVALRVHQERSR
jgi:hypothetical protein